MKNQTTSPLIEKIRALFKMADPNNGATQNEIETAMRKAKELMTKHGIEQMEIGEASQAAEPGIVQESINTGRKRRDEDRWIPVAIKKVFEVDVVFSLRFDPTAGAHGGYRHVYIFVGTPEDTLMARTVLPIIYDAMRIGLNAYLKTNGVKWNTHTANSFFRGVADGFINASVHGQAAAMKQFKKEQQDRFAIVLANKKDAITRYQKDNMNIKAGKASRSRAMHDSAAREAGFRKGSSIDTTTKLAA